MQIYAAKTLPPFAIYTNDTETVNVYLISILLINVEILISNPVLRIVLKICIKNFCNKIPLAYKLQLNFKT